MDGLAVEVEVEVEAREEDEDEDGCTFVDEYVDNGPAVDKHDSLVTDTDDGPGAIECSFEVSVKEEEEEGAFGGGGWNCEEQLGAAEARRRRGMLGGILGGMLSIIAYG